MVLGLSCPVMLLELLYLQLMARTFRHMQITGMLNRQDNSEATLIPTPHFTSKQLATWVCR